MEKLSYVIHGIPVQLFKHNKVFTAHIPLQCGKEVKSLAWVLLFFDRQKFQYDWTTYDIGYYDSVDDIRIEMSINAKDFDQESFEKAIKATEPIQQA